MYGKIYLLCFLLCVALALPAQAQKTQFKISGTKIVIAQDQQFMLKAAQAVQKRDYDQALELYDQALAANSANPQAYIQRSVVRRQTGNIAGAESDARQALHISEAKLRQDPEDPKLYYDRGTAFRYLQEFDKAKENIRYAIQLSQGKNNGWQQDLRAIELEEKMSAR